MGQKHNTGTQCTWLGWNAHSMEKVTLFLLPTGNNGGVQTVKPDSALTLSTHTLVQSRPHFVFSTLSLSPYTNTNTRTHTHKEEEANKACINGSLHQPPLATRRDGWTRGLFQGLLRVSQRSLHHLPIPSQQYVALLIPVGNPQK